MAQHLGPVHSAGAKSPANPILPGGWTIQFRAQDWPVVDSDFEVYHGYVTGPGGSFFVFIETVPYGIGENGFINEYAPTGRNMFVRKGQSVFLHWNISTGNAPQATLWLQLPEGR